MNIKRNLSGFDRVLRITGSALLMYVGFLNTGIVANIPINFLLGSFGFFNLIVAIIGFCPVYYLANISTHHNNDTEQN